MTDWNIVDWVVFILFNIVLNIVFQTLAWKIAFNIGKKGER